MRKEKILLMQYEKAVRERQNKTIVKIYLYIALLLFFSFMFF
jgi:hypothetical protein